MLTRSQRETLSSAALYGGAGIFVAVFGWRLLAVLVGAALAVGLERAIVAEIRERRSRREARFAFLRWLQGSKQTRQRVAQLLGGLHV